ncbi:chlorophyllase-2-like [Nymphaea colorata]|nr:chlorophyllase-2-like [Nymphaea colorata]
MRKYKTDKVFMEPICPEKVWFLCDSNQREREKGRDMSSSSSPASVAADADRVFERGKHGVAVLDIKPGSISTHSPLPHKPLLVFHPREEGEYPVLLFLHGYLLYNSFYSQLLSHIASHAFIIVAPQLYTFALADCMQEIKNAAMVADWIPAGLQSYLPTYVRPDLNRIGLAGHSRGGKVAFALVLGLGAVKTSLRFSALLGVDPVDGKSEGEQTNPPVLKHEPQSLSPKMPILVVGSGLGSRSRYPGLPSCAPHGVNHASFYKECVPPFCYTVATNYGHADMLDDHTPGLRGMASYCLCVNGDRREPMRKFVGGIMVAFLKAYLLNDDELLEKITEKPHNKPVDFTIELKKSVAELVA